MKTRKLCVSNRSILVFALVVLLWGLSASNHSFDDDEFQHAHICWSIAHGIMPYRDFFEHHTPAYHILFAPVVALNQNPSTLFLLRVTSAILGILGLSALFLFLRRRDGEVASLAAIFLLAVTPMFVLKMTEARPEPFAVFCFILGFVLLFAPGVTGKCSDRRIFFAGFLAGFSACLSQKFIFPALGIVLCGFILGGRRSGLRALAGALVSAVMLLAWLALHGLVRNFFYYVILLNARWKYTFSPAGYLYELFSTAGVFLALGIVGLAFILSEGTFRKQEKIAFLLLFLSSLAEIFLVPVPYRQAFLPTLVILSVSASAVLGEIGKYFCGRPAACGIFVLLIAASAPCFFGLKDIWRSRVSDDLNTMRLVEFLDSSGRPVFDGRSLMFYRMHATFYPTMHHEILKMVNLEHYAQDTMKALTRNDYPVVIRDYRVKMMPQEILNFIDAHYCRFKDTDVYLPGRALDRSQLAGGCEFTIDIPGVYTVSWSGEEVSIDGKPVMNGSSVQLDAGSHTVHSSGFTDDFKIILTARK
jgi:hypothetical protein